MKRISVGILILLLAAIPASAGRRFDARTWRRFQTHDVRTLSRNLDSRVGQLVEVHFTFRGKDIRHLKPNWYEGSIWQPDPQGRKGFSNVRVMISKSDLRAFESLPTDAASGSEINVYGKVLWDTDNKFAFVLLIGRNTVVDPAGNANVTW